MLKITFKLAHHQLFKQPAYMYFYNMHIGFQILKFKNLLKHY